MSFAVGESGVTSIDLLHKSKIKTRQRETKDKESQGWLDGLNQTQELVVKEITVVTIADSEADIFDLFRQERPENSHLLIRGTHNRKVDHTAKYLHQAIRATPACGTLVVSIKRNPESSARTAELTIRYAALEVDVPRHHIGRSQFKPVKLQVVLAEEENPPPDVSPISWLIERYHYTLKSGCRIEELQLETARRINMALATYSIVAWRLLWLTYEARHNGDLSCGTVLDTIEWQSLCVNFTQNPIPPKKPQL